MATTQSVDEEAEVAEMPTEEAILAPRAEVTLLRLSFQWLPELFSTLAFGLFFAPMHSYSLEQLILHCMC